MLFFYLCTASPAEPAVERNIKAEFEAVRAYYADPVRRWFIDLSESVVQGTNALGVASVVLAMGRDTIPISSEGLMSMIGGSVGLNGLVMAWHYFKNSTQELNRMQICQIFFSDFFDKALKMSIDIKQLKTFLGQTMERSLRDILINDIARKIKEMQMQLKDLRDFNHQIFFEQAIRLETERAENWAWIQTKCGFGVLFIRVVAAIVTMVGLASHSPPPGRTADNVTDGGNRSAIISSSNNQVGAPSVFFAGAIMYILFNNGAIEHLRLTVQKKAKEHQDNTTDLETLKRWFVNQKRHYSSIFDPLSLDVTLIQKLCQYMDGECDDEADMKRVIRGVVQPSQAAGATLHVLSDVWRV